MFFRLLTVEKSLHVTPLFRPRPRVPRRGRPPGLHGPLCVPEAWRSQEVDPDHERSSIRRLEAARAYDSLNPSRPRRSTSLRSTQTAMPSPNIVYQVALRIFRGEDRPPRCAGWRALQAAGMGRAGRSLSRERRSRPRGRRRLAQRRRSSPLRGWRSDPFFFDTRGAINNFQFTGEDFFAERDVL